LPDPISRADLARDARADLARDARADLGVMAALCPDLSGHNS